MSESRSNRRSTPIRALAQQSPAAVFILNPNHRLQYVNPAWEQLTGRTLAQVRGTRVSAERKSASPFWQSLAPPPEVWSGQSQTVRRPAPEQESGPPWWDIAFLPIPGIGNTMTVMATISVVGVPPARGEYREPASLAALRFQTAQRYAFDRLTGPSVASERLLSQVRFAARTTQAIWLSGEPGTGKETIARIIHQNGLTADHAFIAVDAGCLEAYLVESLLFGKGGLLAAPVLGTLYLAEPHRLPPLVQSRIAEWFDPISSAPLPRLICSGLRSPGEELAAGTLIPPFHTRICVTEISVPPLRDRFTDLPNILERIHPILSELTDKPVEFSSDCVSALTSYHWPGNLRELMDVLAVAARNADSGVMEVQHLPRFLQEKHLIAKHPLPPKGREWTLDQILESVERRLIEQALTDNNGSQTAAAEQLGIFRTRLGRRIEALGISVEDRKSGTPDTSTR